MQSYKIIALDETGKASYAHSSRLFILSGIVIPEEHKNKLDNKLRKIKKKFFDDENIVFHARDMHRKKGPFVVLRDPEIEIRFWAEFISVVNNEEISAFFVLVNKENAEKANWQEKTILSRSYKKALEEFAIKQPKKYKGKIIAESDPQQDLFLIKAHNYLQSEGTSDGSMTGKEYRNKITSLSLVNKNNFDADVQVADSLAVVAGFYYEINHLDNTLKLSKTDKAKIRLIERKINKKRNPSSFSVLI